MMNTRPMHVVVHSVSYRYVSSVVDWILSACRCSVDGEGDSSPVMLHLVRDIVEVKFRANSLILVIGDLFGPFERVSGCTYVFLNFSLLYDLSVPFSFSREGREWISKKRLAMYERANRYDMVADFLPEQTPRLARELRRFGVSVLPFMVNVLVSKKLTCRHAEQWDLCVVGSTTVRRQNLNQRLRFNGLSLSPESTNALNQVMAESRIVLNVHAYATRTTEYPRIIEALKLGRFMITEPCIGLDAVIPRNLYATVRYSRIPSVARDFIANPGSYESIATRAREFMIDVHDARAEALWKALLARAS